jgi:predicted phosphodiesterase
MAVQIISDLHLEAPKAYDIFEITPKAPYLALLGDIGTIDPHKTDCLAFFKRQLAQFCAVLFVPGNHEAYHSTWTETLSILRAFEDDVRTDTSLGDFILLDRAAYEIPDTNVVVLGCSLFSHVPAASEMDVSLKLNDFLQIADWDVAAHNAAHVRDIAWLNAQVEALARRDVRILILTHWSPSRDARAADPRHAVGSITSAFSTDMADELCFREDKVKVWAFGHTHFNCDFSVEREGAGPLRLVTNQRGYHFSQASGMVEDKVVKV